MACIKEDFSHEMIDGEYMSDEVNKLNIQGVPSIFYNTELIHSGKISLINLIAVCFFPMPSGP